MEYRRSYLNTLDARHFVATFSDGWKSMMFDRLVVRRDTDIGAEN